MIDLHCHVLPDVDDGPGSLEESVAMARQAAADGVTVIAATPHVDVAHPHVTSELVAASVRETQAALDEANVPVRIVPGAEVAGVRAMELGRDELSALTLGGGPWLLLECPLSPTATPGFPSVVRAMPARGVRVVLAHPERSPLFLRSPALLDELVVDGVLVQVTASALSGRFGRTVRTFARDLVARGVAQIVASDGHGGQRPPVLRDDLAAAALPPELVEWLTERVPDAVLAGDRIPGRPTVVASPPQRRGLRRLLR